MALRHAERDEYIPCRGSLSALRIVLCLPLLFLLAGCGKVGNHAAIHGTVTLDGKPLERGSILFEPTGETKGAVTGGEIKDGRYDLPRSIGPAIGWNRVRIMAVRRTGRMLPNPMGPPGSMNEVYEGAVAARFDTESILKVEVHAGDNAADFAAESK
jgi:hypothetical protein